MECLGCGFSSPPGFRFCGQCGRPLVTPCPDCGVEGPVGGSHCDGCGRRLTPVGDELSPLPPTGEGAERRQLTVMFCDVVESTALAERLDPEELREVIRGYQETAVGVVERYAGHVAQYLGDGLLVYFGYPQAHEDDARRAILAGLGIVEAMAVRVGAAGSRGVRLAVRVGIHTGPVVTGEVGAGSQQATLALGPTPNLAARLQGLAEPGTVVLSADTERLVRGYFELESLGAPSLKGSSRQMALYRALGPLQVESRFAPAGDVVPAVVGRAQELGLLAERFERARRGPGQVVVVQGEAGIGKSRLLHDFKERVVGEEATWWTCYCSPYATETAFHPIIELLRKLFGLESDDVPDQRVAKVEEGIRSIPFDAEEAMPLLAALLSLRLDDRYRPLVATPQRQRERTLEVLQALVLRSSEERPVVLAVEDLHWVDPSSLELFELLVRRAAAGRVLVLFTARPDFEAPWEEGVVTRVSLERLVDQDVAQLAERIAGKPLPPEIVRRIQERTDGVPLFVEELTKMVLEAGLLEVEAERWVLRGPLPALTIPMTLQDSLMARLDRLATVKGLAQLAAVLGRRFTYRMLAAVSTLDAEILEQGLARLVEAGLLYARGVPPRATFTFKHALIQDVAYASLLRSTRRECHRRIARALVAGFEDVVENQPAEVARHFTEAGLVEEAVQHWLRAGRKAIGQSANVEAVAHLRLGLELLGQLPESPDRDRTELAIETALGTALQATEGYTTRELERTHRRALELCERIGDPRQLFGAMWGLTVFYQMRGELDQALDISRELLRLAERSGMPVLHMEAETNLGIVHSYRGELEAAHRHVWRGVELMVSLGEPDDALTGHDITVRVLVNQAWVLWQLGSVDAARRTIARAVERSRQLGHLYNLSYVLLSAGLIFAMGRELAAMRDGLEESDRLARELGFGLWLDWGEILLGRLLAEEGRGAEGLPMIERGLASYRKGGSSALLTFLLSLLAEARLLAGRPAAGLEAVEEAASLAAATGERFWLPEVRRLEGELRLAVRPDDGEAAEACFAQALDLARRQGVRPLELRAAVSLGRAWSRGGRREAAEELVAAVYGGFEEGQGTGDLEEARQLLAALRGSPELA